MWMKFQYGRRRSWVDGSGIFVLYEWVVKIDRLANKSTHWPVGWPIHQVQPVAKNADLLVNGSTRWPTSYNWRVGYNSSGIFTLYP